MFGKEGLQIRPVFSHCMCKDLIDWVKHKLHKDSLPVLRRWLWRSLKLSVFSVKVVISPQKAFENMLVDSWKSLFVFLSKEFQAKHKAILCSCKDDIVKNR